MKTLIECIAQSVSQTILICHKQHTVAGAIEAGELGNIDYLEAVHQSLCSFGIDTAIVEHALTPTEQCQSGDASEEAVKVVASQIYAALLDSESMEEFALSVSANESLEEVDWIVVACDALDKHYDFESMVISLLQQASI